MQNMTWAQMVELTEGKNNRRITELMTAISDYQKSSLKSQQFYASAYAKWVKQLKKLAPEVAEYLGV